MKQSKLITNFIIKLLLLWTFITLSASAIELKRDSFNSTLDGWSGTGVSHDNNSMKINRDKTAIKTYALGSAYANRKVMISFDISVTSQWESNQDRLQVWVNYYKLDSYYYGSGSHSEWFIGRADSDGEIRLEFKANTNNSNEIAWMDNIVISTIGCDNTLDRNNDVAPGLVITDMHNITTDTTDCISGSSKNSDQDYYHFTVAVAGTLNFNASSPNDHKYYFTIESTQTTFLDEQRAEVHTGSEHLSAGETIYLRMKETGSDTDFWQVNLEFIADIIAEGPPIVSPIPNQSTLAANPYTLDLSTFVQETNQDPIASYTLSGTLPLGLNFNSSTGILSGTPIVSITTGFNLSLTATEVGNSTSSDPQAFVLTIIVPPLHASNNVYSLTPGSNITGNLITDDTGAGVDTGAGFTLTSNTNPSEGTLTVNSSGGFTYTPISSPSNTITFTYTISDGTGTDTARVTISIATDYQHGYQSFQLINPIETRNIVGNYKIAGNTVLCLTEKTSGYGGTCHGKTDYKDQKNNNHVTKYIDIDGDSRTWNSTSSYIEIPSNYDRLGGKGIVWAGLFWQARIAKDDGSGDKEMRYGLENGSGYTLVETGRGSGYTNIDIQAAEANKIKLKIDGGSYNDVTASTLSDFLKDNSVLAYAAFADVTAILQSANLASGKHTFTVANLTGNEGRENTTGIYGGWALVVIYLEDPLNGSPKNISIYNGFDFLTKHNDPISISGFRLPTSGNTITANLSIFSGEGEYANRPDTIQISNSPSSNYEDMPGASDSNNIFDGQLDGILRDEVPGHHNNLTMNNNAIDVDNFDVSTIMTAYRDDNPLIQNIYIKYYSGGDSIYPSMMAFSTELYQPNICYDYTLDIDGYVFNSINNEVNVSFGGQTNAPITTRVSIQSQEGDFDLNDVNITYRLADSTQLQYITDSTALAKNGISSYIPAGTNGLRQTYAQVDYGFGMYIGVGATSMKGGKIGSYETRYLKFDTEMMQSSINTRFDLWIEYTVDYGSGPLPLSKNFNQGSLCKANGGYYPAYNIFNIASSQAEINPSSNDFGMPYNLYTQVVNKPFDLSILSYDKDYLTPNEVDTSIEVEMFNAGHFNRDTNVSCFNPDSNITLPIFVRFNNDTSVPFSNMTYPEAIRNTGFRIWYLTKPDGSFIEHPCSTRYDESCFRSLYTDNYSADVYCQEECSTGSNCYPCLRRFYGKPICSRDNFSVRPEAFITQVLDSNENNLTNVETKALASSTSLSTTSKLVAGYKYRFDINATSYSSDNAVKGYHKEFNKYTNSSWSRINWEGGSSLLCNNTQNQDIAMSIFNGTSINLARVPNESQLAKSLEVGEYSFSIEDENWTAADWFDGYLGHHYDASTGNLRSGFMGGTDCIPQQTIMGTGSSQNGCLISSTHSRGSKQYNAIPLEFYPYGFALSLSQGGHPGLSKDFVYINTLDSSLEDDNISYNIKGSFRVKGYNDEVLSNFVDGCYAENTDMKLSYTYLSERPSNTPNLTYELKDYNTTNTEEVIRPRSRHTLGTAEVEGTKSDKIIPQLENYYETSMKGAITMDLGINFDRMNTPVNPRRIQFNDLNISLTSKVQTNVNLKDDHEIFGNLAINNNITFLYARVKPARLLYDDILDPFVLTPISVVVYCELGFALCKDLGINTDDGQTSEFDWWKSWKHDTDEDGKIEIKSIYPALLSPRSVSIYDKGENSTVRVSRGTLALPATVPVELVTDNTLADYTDRWLLYNVTNPFYEVRFIGESGWAGHGNTGHVVGGESNVKKNRRLEW